MQGFKPCNEVLENQDQGQGEGAQPRDLVCPRCKDFGYAENRLKFKATSQFTTLQVNVLGTALSDISRMFLSLKETPKHPLRHI